MLKVYFDNDVASAVSRRDLNQVELGAIDQLIELYRSGKIRIGISRQSHREMERAPSQHQPKLKAGVSDLQLAANDHVVLGFHNDRYCSYPLVTDIVDETLYASLLAKKLKPDDAKHFMYAVHNAYERFLTCDHHFLDRRSDLEASFRTIRIQKPSELVANLPSVSERTRTDPTLSAGGAYLDIE